MFNLWLDYPSFEEEKRIVSQTTATQKDEISAVLDKDQIIYLQNLVREVAVPENVLEAAVRLVNMIHPGSPHSDEQIDRYLSLGDAPRASQILFMGRSTCVDVRGDTT